MIQALTKPPRIYFLIEDLLVDIKGLIAFLHQSDHKEV